MASFAGNLSTTTSESFHPKLLHTVRISNMTQLLFLTRTDYTKVALQITTLIVIFLFSFLSNCLVFVVFCRRPSLLNLSNRFVLNLSVSNILLTVLVMPLVGWSTLEGGWPLSTHACQVIGTITTLLVAACLFTLTAIALDRYNAIMRPLHYDINLSAVKAGMLIALIWLAALLVSIPPLFGWNHIEFQMNKGLCMVDWHTPALGHRIYSFSFVILCFLVPYILMMWVYVTVFKAAQKTTALARRNSLTPDASESTLQPTLTSRRRSSVTSLLHAARRRSSSSRSILSSLHRDDWKAAKTALLVMSTFTLCWMPVFFLITAEAILASDDCIPEWLQSSAVWIALAGCALNPLVYVFRSSAVKQEVKFIFGLTSREHQISLEIKESLKERESRQYDAPTSIIIEEDNSLCDKKIVSSKQSNIISTSLSSKSVQGGQHFPSSVHMKQSFDSDNDQQSVNDDKQTSVTFTGLIPSQDLEAVPL